MSHLRNLSLALALVTSAAATAFASPIVANGDFQTGTLSSWHVTGNNYPWSIGTDLFNDFASTGCVGATCITGSTPSALYQDLSTVAGHTYTLSFLYASAGTPSELEVLFGSTVADDLINSSTSTATYTVSNLLASGSTTRLDFLGRQDPGYNFLDNISVVDNGPSNSAVPEPGTIGLVGTGVLGLLGAARRRFIA